MDIELLIHLTSLKPHEKEDLIRYFEEKYPNEYANEPKRIKMVIEDLDKSGLIHLWTDDYTFLGGIHDGKNVYGFEQFKADGKQIKAIIK